MKEHPFQQFRQFKDLIDLRLLTREDNISSDADIARVIGRTAIASLQQEHGVNTVVIHEPSSRVYKGDALATDRKGIALTIRFADCQNVLIFHKEKRVICLVHAGWRGVRSSVVSHAFDMLRSQWAIDPIDTHIGLGPALCRKCSGFTDPHTEAPELAKFFRQNNTIDLREALETELVGLGVQRKRIERMLDCPRCHPETYFTYRGGDKEAVEKGFVNCLAVTLKK